jgi:hypothetical protein
MGFGVWATKGITGVSYQYRDEAPLVRLFELSIAVGF